MKRFKLFLIVVAAVAVAYSTKLYFVGYMTRINWQYQYIHFLGWMATVVLCLVFLTSLAIAAIGLFNLLFVEKVPKVKIVIER